MLDSSVSTKVFKWMTAFTERLSQLLSINDEKFRVGLMKFSTDAHTQFNLDAFSTNDGVLSGVGELTHLPGVRNTGEAINYVRTMMFTPNNGDRNWARNYILLLTGEQQR